MSERDRNWVDTSEKIALSAGAGGLLLSIFFPPLFGPSLILLGGGAGIEVAKKEFKKK